MGRASITQNAFNAGELSQLLYGRQDVKKYAHGLATCFNALPLSQGAWTRRPGTVRLHQTKFNDRESRLFPFQYSVTQTYILEFGHLYVRFFTSHGLLANASQSITSITKAAVGVLTKVAHGYSNGDRLYLTMTAGMTQLCYREVVVTNKTADTFELYNSDGVAIATTGFDTFTAGTMAKIFEVVTPYTEADVASLRLTQSADTLYITHTDYQPRTLVRTSALSWTLALFAFLDGPYDSVNSTSTTLTPSAASGAITITASAVTGINAGLGFQTTDIGRLIRIQHSSTWGYAKITAWTSTTVVSATVVANFAASTAQTSWRLGTWSDTTGWPICSTFYDDRLFFAGVDLYPQRLDGSKTGDYTNFAPSNGAGTVAADNAVAFTLNADDVNAIRWMSPNEKALLVGTARAEWQIKASALNEAITPTNISGKPSTRHGSAAIQPVVVSNAVIFVQRAARKLRELAYVFEADGFRAPDMTLLSEHVTRGGVIELAYAAQPQAVVWAARDDGMLLGMTYERDQDVVAWHRHSLGGYSNAGHTAAAIVESIAAVPSPDASRDELYLVAKRYINGGTKRFVEYMTKVWESEDEQEDAFYVDCGFTVVNSPATATITCLSHYEGETLGCYVDGSKHIDVTVANGKVTLERTGTIVTLGYFYNSDGETLPIEGGSQDGSAQGKLKDISRIGFWLADTLGMKQGPDEDNLTEILNRQWGDDYGVATSLFTGVYRDRFEGNYDRLGQVYWRADGPFPATVLSVMPQFDVSDDS